MRCSLLGRGIAVALVIGAACGAPGGRVAPIVDAGWDPGSAPGLDAARDAGAREVATPADVGGPEAPQAARADAAAEKAAVPQVDAAASGGEPPRDSAAEAREAGGAAGAAGAAGSCKGLPAGYADGSVTWYTLDQGSQAVNCSYDIVRRNPDTIAHVPFGGGLYFAAMNTQDYAAAATCGACVEVTRDGARKVSVMVVDQCPVATNPKCTAGHLDLSQEAFKQLGTIDEGYLGTSHGGAKGHISWRYVPCPTTEDVSFRLKDAGNVYWNQILVQGHRNPLAKVEVNVGGTWQAATRQPYNYWQVGGGNLGPAPYRVRATDVGGATVEASLTLRAGDQASGAQFPECR